MFLPKNICQSCGMPLKKDPQGGGTEKNGAKSTLYCSHCYQNGVFTDPHVTVDQMVVRVDRIMKEKKLPWLVRWFFCKTIPKLQRWKSCSSCK